MRDETLQEIAAYLARTPGHEAVRASINRVLTEGLGARQADVALEQPVPEVRGRIDALLGRTVFEFKRDLDAELQQAEEQLTRYLGDRERQTGERYVGIATDGAQYRVYSLRDRRLELLQQYRLRPEAPREWLGWLDGALAVGVGLQPEPVTIREQLGKASIAYLRALQDIRSLWAVVAEHPEAKLKWQLWQELVRVAYSQDVADEELFFQHTYLTIVAKTFAANAGLVPPPGDAEAILSGKCFRDVGVFTPVDHDFFSWVLLAADGTRLVEGLARHAARFRLDDLHTDILKALYENLIDPEQRHDLGEYYTPDWLAARICEETIDDPLHQRVLDPACGSGTFLFHAVRKAIQAARDDGMAPAAAIERATHLVYGIDVHPVAVIFAGVTYLLALRDAWIDGRPETVHIPVYLGDSLQWKVYRMLPGDRLTIDVPGGPMLEFPTGVAHRKEVFDRALDLMLEHSQGNDTRDQFERVLVGDPDIDAGDRSVLVSTYETLRALTEDGRNHIWGYIARNLSRPIWLSAPEQRADRIVGNPPWVRFASMSGSLQPQFRAKCDELGLWVGGKVAQGQDLAALFYVKAVELYLKPQGRIGMVLPFAAMSRQAYEGFRSGRYPPTGDLKTTLHFTGAWSFEHQVKPLFEVPSCALFGKEGHPGPLPDEITAYSGTLPHRDATTEQADACLTATKSNWPGRVYGGGSAYRDDFAQGATLVPRRLVLVELAPAGALGHNPAAPVVQGREGNLDKPPWKYLPPPRGAVEAEFLRPVYLGESIAPFRVLGPTLGVVPWDEARGFLMDAEAAGNRGFHRLRDWLGQCERTWEAHKKAQSDFRDWLDYYGKLTAQFPVAPIRVVYAASGTNPAAAMIRDPKGVVEHGLYWCAAHSEEEARFLAAILSSNTLRLDVLQYQNQGQFGPRHFDKYVFNVPFPRFDAAIALHAELAQAAEEAEAVAGAVELDEGIGFQRARRIIRDALHEAGIAQRIDGQVDRLLEPYRPAVIKKRLRQEGVPEPARRRPARQSQ